MFKRPSLTHPRTRPCTSTSTCIPLVGADSRSTARTLAFLQFNPETTTPETLGKH